MGAILGPVLSSQPREVEFLAGDLLPASRSQVWGAWAGAMWDAGPVVGLVESAELDRLTGDFLDQTPMDRGITGAGGPEQREMGLRISPLLDADALERASREREELSPVLRPDEATARFAQPGLTFDEPIREDVAAILSRNRADELVRRDIMARGPHDALTTVGGLAVAFAVSALDPLNIASAFVPVVGPARMAAMSARLGTTGARLARGAIEGGAGALLLEPVVYATARDRGFDYDAVDSLLNVTFGTALGGGLHVGLGALSDRLARLHPSTRENALRSAVAQFATDRPVAVDRLVELDPAWRGETLFRDDLLSGTALGRASDDGLGDFLGRGGDQPDVPTDPITSNIDLRDPWSQSPSDLRYVSKHVSAGNTRQVIMPIEDLPDAEVLGNYALADGSDLLIVRNGAREIAAIRPWADEKQSSLSFGEYVGKVVVNRDRSIEHVVVSPELRRQGLATHLLSEAEKRLDADILVAADRSPDGAALLESIRIGRLPSPEARSMVARARAPRAAGLSPEAVETIQAAARDNWNARVGEPSVTQLRRVAALAGEGTAQLRADAAPDGEAAEVAAELADIDAVLGRLRRQGAIDKTTDKALAAPELTEETRRVAEGYRAAAACMMRRAA